MVDKRKHTMICCEGEVGCDVDANALTLCERCAYTYYSTGKIDHSKHLKWLSSRRR